MLKGEARMRKIIAVLIGFGLGGCASYMVGLLVKNFFDSHIFGSQFFHTTTRNIGILCVFLLMFFISAVISGYIARNRGKFIGFLIASPISVGGLYVLARAAVAKDIGTAVSEYVMVLIFSIAMMLIPSLGGAVGQTAAYKRQKIKKT